MGKEEVLKEITKTLGGVPGWLERLEGPQLEHVWGHTAWFLSDTKLTAREKALVALGTASANRCPY